MREIQFLAYVLDDSRVRKSMSGILIRTAILAESLEGRVLRSVAQNKFDQLRAILQLPALKIFKLLFVGEVLRFVSQESN